MKNNMTASNITARIVFGSFSNGVWAHSDAPSLYASTTKTGKETLRFDCHLSLDDGTVISVPAFGQTALMISRMMVTGSDGALRPIRSGDMITVSIPGTTFKRSASYHDSYRGIDLMADYHNAPYLSLPRSNSYVARSENGVQI